MLLPSHHAGHPQAAQAAGASVPVASVAGTTRSGTSGDASGSFSLMLSGALSSKQSGSAAPQTAANDVMNAGMEKLTADADAPKAGGGLQVVAGGANGQPTSPVRNPLRQVAKHDLGNHAAQPDEASTLPVGMTFLPLPSQPQTTPVNLNATAGDPARSASPAPADNTGGLSSIQTLDGAVMAAAPQAPGLNPGADRSMKPAVDLTERGDVAGRNAKLGDATPGNSKLGKAALGDATLGDVKLGDAKPGGAKLGDAKPGDAKPGDAKPGAAKPGAAKPGAAKPGDARAAAQRGRAETPASGHAARAPILGASSMPLTGQDAGQPARAEPVPGVTDLGANAMMGAAASGHSHGGGNPPAAVSNEAGPAGPPLPPPPPAAQLGQALAKIHTSADGSSHVTIRLDPLELGSVEVRISRAHDGSASVSVAVERPETLRSMQADLAHLHQALDRVGLPEQRSLVLHLAPQENAGSAGQGGAGTSMGQSGFQQDGSQQGRGGAAAPSRSAVFGETTDHEPTGRSGSLAGVTSRWLRAGINITA